MAILLELNAKNKKRAVKGGSKIKGFEEHVPVLSVGYDISKFIQESSGSTGRRSNSEMSDFSMAIAYDESLPALMSLALSDKVVYEAIIKFLTGGDKPTTFLELRMSDAMLSSFSFGASGDGEPSINVEWSPTKVQWSHTPLDEENNPGSPLKGGYDMIQNNLL